MTEPATGEHTITYYVNGEPETTEERELTVQAILESAELTPASDYTLTSENPPKDYDSNYDEVVKVHPNQRFRALFKGTTPVS
jgi:hypothetical protein